MKKIRSAIGAALNEATNIDKIIDGPGDIDIPIEDYIINEANLSDADTAILTAARLTAVVDHISVEFTWNFDVEQINITAFTNA